MLKYALTSVLLLLGLNLAQANELDQEGSVTNQTLQGTVVMRVDNRTQAVAMATADGRTTSELAAQNLAKKSAFKALPASKVKNELDQDGGASSWYWYSNSYNYSYNYLYWYGYSYRPYYYYNYSYYTYYYYNRWNYGW
jgi:hypothetical protein